jgi:hypothetical protein
MSANDVSTNAPSTPRPERWLLGQGLFLRKATITVTRTANRDPLGLSDNPAQFADRWEIVADHADGHGGNVATTLVFDFGHYNWDSWINAVSVSNENGSLIFQNISSNDYEPPERTLLRQIAESVRRELLAITGWKLALGSPLGSSDDVGAAIQATAHNIKLSVLDPSASGFIDAATYVNDIVSGQPLTLSRAMWRMSHSNAAIYSDTCDRQSAVLRLRYHELDPIDPPDGHDYNSAVRALVEQGMGLGPYRVDGDPDEYEMDSLLHEACRDQRPLAVTALLLSGASPLEKIRRSLHEKATSSFEEVAYSGYTDGLALMLEYANPSDRAQMLAELDMRFLTPNSKIREKLLQEHPSARATCSFAAAYKARSVVGTVIEAARKNFPGGATRS